MGERHGRGYSFIAPAWISEEALLSVAARTPLWSTTKLPASAEHRKTHHTVLGGDITWKPPVDFTQHCRPEELKERYYPEKQTTHWSSQKPSLSRSSNIWELEQNFVSFFLLFFKDHLTKVYCTAVWTLLYYYVRDFCSKWHQTCVHMISKGKVGLNKCAHKHAHACLCVHRVIKTRPKRITVTL